MKGIAALIIALCLPPLAAGQSLPRYRVVELGPGTNMLSITPNGQALFHNSNGRSALYDPITGLRTLPGTYHAHGLLDNGDAYGEDFQERALIWRRQTNTYTEYFPIPGIDGRPSLTGATRSGVAVGQLLGASGLGLPARWSSPTTGELLMDSTGLNPAVYVQYISESGYALGSDGPNNGCIWDPDTNIARVLRPNNKRVSLAYMAANGWIAANWFPADGITPSEAYILDSAGNILHQVNPYAGRSISFGRVDATDWASGASYRWAGSNYDNRAVIWSPSTGIVELESLVDNPPTGMELDYCYKSESGGILAQGPIFNGRHRQMYYLVPVPEPGTLIALGVGPLALLLRRRRPLT